MMSLAGSLVLIALGWTPAPVGPALSSLPVVLVRQGDVVPGVGLVTRIDDLAVNDSGTWLVTADTDADASSDEVVLRAEGLYLRENQSLAEPPGAALSSVGALTLTNAGHSGWRFLLRNAPVSADSGLYFDTHLLLREGETSHASGFSAGTSYLGFLNAKIDDAGRIAVVATVDDPQITSVIDRALVIMDLDGSHDLATETVVAKEGDHLTGQLQTVADFGAGPHQLAWSKGHVLFFADLTGPTTKDGVIYLDSRKIAQEADPSPEPGEPYSVLLGHALDVNGLGETAFKANVGGDPFFDEAIIVEGRELVRQGSTFPAIASFFISSIGTPGGPLPMDDERNVLWSGEWNNPDPEKDTALFLNDVVLVQEGTPVGGGRSMVSFASGEHAFAMSRNGRYVVFEATLDDGTEAAVRIEVDGPPPVPDGALVPGAPLKARRSPNGTDIDVTWDAAACPAGGYNLFYGDLASVSTLTYSGAACGLGATGQASFTPPAGSLFFLVAAVSAGVEGGHGYDSRGRARHASAGGMCGVVGQIRSPRCP